MTGGFYVPCLWKGNENRQGQDFLYFRESYQQISKLILLVIGCSI